LSGDYAAQNSNHITVGTKSGALYLYDQQAVEHLTQSSGSILSASGWPLDADQFVARIAREWIDPAHPLAPVIRQAFGEEGA
jgi:hypothetical protein